MKYLTAMLLAWFAFGSGVAALIGHFDGNIILASWKPGQVPMAISTACAMIALSISVLLRCCRKEHSHHD